MASDIRTIHWIRFIFYDTQMWVISVLCIGVRLATLWAPIACVIIWVEFKKKLAHSNNWLDRRCVISWQEGSETKKKPSQRQYSAQVHKHTHTHARAHTLAHTHTRLNAWTCWSVFVYVWVISFSLIFRWIFGRVCSKSLVKRISGRNPLKIHVWCDVCALACV